MDPMDAILDGQKRAEAGHTPGPWHNDSLNYGYDSRYVCGPKHADGGDYAPICIADTEANARLIAAAPELLEQLIHARAFIPMNQPALRESVNAAIAKAEGRA